MEKKRVCKKRKRFNSLEFFKSFIENENGVVSVEEIFTTRCYEQWKDLQTEQFLVPEAKFFKQLTGHVRGRALQSPFPQAVEAKLLELLRLTDENVFDRVFKPNSQLIGRRKFAHFGYYELAAQDEIEELSSASGSSYHSSEDEFYGIKKTRVTTYGLLTEQKISNKGIRSQLNLLPADSKCGQSSISSLQTSIYGESFDSVEPLMSTTPIKRLEALVSKYNIAKLVQKWENDAFKEGVNLFPDLMLLMFQQQVNPMDFRYRKSIYEVVRPKRSFIAAKPVGEIYISSKDDRNGSKQILDINADGLRLLG